MRTVQRVLPRTSHLMAHWPRYLLDSVLACSGSLLITGIILAFQLYPRIPNISNLYLLVVLVLAITRGRYAAIFSAVVAFLSLVYFIVPPLYTLAVISFEEWTALCIFLLVALLTAQLATALRERAERANRREHETHQQLLASEQAARAEAEAERARLYELFMQVPATTMILGGP